MNAIKLNFINRSNDANNSQVVIFQKNVSGIADDTAVAWKVIKNCGTGDNHPFQFPFEFMINASDSWGNYTPQLPAPGGSAFEMILNPSGDILRQSSTPAEAPNSVEVRNALNMGAISAYCYLDGSLCAQKTGIAPGSKAVFSFKTTLWIGVVSEMEEGAVMNSAVISSLNTELNLLGIAAADIVMTGGGTGESAEPFRFTFENIVFA